MLTSVIFENNLSFKDVIAISHFFGAIIVKLAHYPLTWKPTNLDIRTLEILDVGDLVVVKTNITSVVLS